MKVKAFLLTVILILTFTGCSKNTDQNTDNNNVAVEENVTDIVADEQEIEYFTVTKDNPMENRGLLLEIIGSMVYDKIEGKDFTDTPSEGKKYLVIYLNLKNTSGKDEYFNYNNISAKLDGEEITDVFLLNDPLKYTTFKTHLTDHKFTQGYLAWEVPEDWKKLEVTYTGWTQTHYTEPTIVITPENLEEPEEYKEDNRII